MTIGEWLTLAVEALQQSGIDSARLDALLLLEDALGQDRAWLLAHPEHDIPQPMLEPLAEQLERRLQHEPLAYIRGFAEFYGRRFMVTPNVLVPRPESEAMIDLYKKLASPGVRLADIGTGSGCLAVTAALESSAVACAVDIDEACLTVAGQNAVSHTASIRLEQGSLLEPFISGAASDFRPQTLLANLPYVPNDYAINEAARHEPALALFAGSDGLDAYREFFKQIAQLPERPELVLTEALHEQHEALRDIGRQAGFDEHTSQDLIQAFK